MTEATAYPTLRYEDPAAVMDWLERALGFERREDHRDDDGNVVHAEMSLGGALVMLSAVGTGREAFSQVGPGGVVYIGTDTVASLYERARGAGAEIPLELSDTDYGSTDFAVRDPEGTVWAFGTYRP
jgi:uncharacterized glyoxalase superfamily protein PhnB